MIKKMFTHPLAKKLAIDDPLASELHREIILGNSFLKKIYEEWYNLLLDSFPPGISEVLEIGSGGGFFKEFSAKRGIEVISSDVIPISGVDLICDATKRLPFEDGSLQAITMVDVLHHLPDCNGFFAEANRSLQAGGVICMIEPWPTFFSKFVYRFLHHEGFEDMVNEWSFSSSGPLSGANPALPWIIFQRDRSEFRKKYPELNLGELRLLMPFVYLFSGGVSMRQLTPGSLYKLFRGIESPFTKIASMFAFIVITKSNKPERNLN